MKDYGGFGDESFYDWDCDGKLDVVEEALMHADHDLQMLEMLEMDNKPRPSRTSKLRKESPALFCTKILNFCELYKCKVTSL